MFRLAKAALMTIEAFLVSPHACLPFSRNVYLGGIEPSLRKVAWRILLNIYPAEVTGRERIALLSSKIAKYERMKSTWKQAYKEGRLTKTQIDAIALASVDVVRTDRSKCRLCGKQ